MAWRSPFQSTKNGGVPFPALTPWANSPGQLSDSGSPMQISPDPVLKSVIKKGQPATSLKTTSSSKASPMDAAPYTPLSARRGVVGSIKDSDKKDRFVGKLSFTPHVSQHRHSNSAHKRSPDSSPGESSTISTSLAQPPQSSLYIAEPKTLNAVTASDGEQPSIPQFTVTGKAYACKLQLCLCCVPCHQTPLTQLHSNDLYNAPFLQAHLHLNKQQHLQQLAEQDLLPLLPLMKQAPYLLPNQQACQEASQSYLAALLSAQHSSHWDQRPPGQWHLISLTALMQAIHLSSLFPTMLIIMHRCPSMTRRARLIKPTMRLMDHLMSPSSCLSLLHPRPWMRLQSSSCILDLQKQTPGLTLSSQPLLVLHRPLKHCRDCCGTKLQGSRQVIHHIFACHVQIACLSSRS